VAIVEHAVLWLLLLKIFIIEVRELWIDSLLYAFFSTYYCFIYSHIYVCVICIVDCFVVHCRSTFRTGLVQGEKPVVYHIMEWLLRNTAALKKRAYLAKFLVKVEVPADIMAEDPMTDLYVQVRFFSLLFLWCVYKKTLMLLFRACVGISCSLLLFVILSSDI